MQSNGSGTLAQLLRTHQSATYVQIPQTARPGESKLEAGAALLLPIEKKNIVGLPNNVVSTNGRNRKSNTLKKEMELVLYDRVRLQLKSLMEELERMNVCGSEKIRDRIYCWFAEAGTAMTSTMLILSFSSHITPLLGYMKFSRAKKLARKNADTAVSQPDLNGKFVGDPYDFQTSRQPTSLKKKTNCNPTRCTTNANKRLRSPGTFDKLTFAVCSME